MTIQKNISFEEIAWRLDRGDPAVRFTLAYEGSFWLRPPLRAEEEHAFVQQAKELFRTVPPDEWGNLEIGRKFRRLRPPAARRLLFFALQAVAYREMALPKFLIPIIRLTFDLTRDDLHGTKRVQERLRAARAIAQGSNSDSATAKAAGTSRQNVENWKKDKAFHALVEQLRTQKQSPAMTPEQIEEWERQFEVDL